MESCQALTSRLKAVNTSDVAHIMYMEVEKAITH